MAARRRQGNSRGGALLWFLVGLVLGLGVAIFAYQRGWMPQGEQPPQAQRRAPSAGDPPLLEEDAPAEDVGSRYDFFTVLPEMEVVVPEGELATSAEPEAAVPAGAGGERFILQAGSFRNAEDAEARKAQLALLGAVASVQKVTVDNQAWFRVRIGPLDGARAADQLRRQLQDNGIEVMVLKEPS